MSLRLARLEGADLSDLVVQGGATFSDDTKTKMVGSWCVTVGLEHGRELMSVGC